MRFADIIAELKTKYCDDLENIERPQPTDAEIAARLTQMALGASSAPYKGKDRLTDDDIEQWATEAGIPAEALIDGIAMYLAREFHAGTLPFRFCDAIINQLETLSLHGSSSSYPAHADNQATQGRSKLIHDIYLAFDAGEYRRPHDDRNPVAAFTRPAIAEIVDGNSGFVTPDDSL